MSPHTAVPHDSLVFANSPRSTLIQNGSATSVITVSTRIRLAGFILLTSLVLDQVSKWYAVRNFPDEPWIFLGDTFRLQLAYNTGAFLGLAGTWSPETRFWLLTVLNGVFLLGLSGIVLRHWRMPLGRFVAAVGILSGGIGNMIDRVTNEGKVTDFMNMGIGSLRTGIFNIADMAITGGALLLAWIWIQEDREKQKQGVGK